jgi:hypothetical protein
MRDAVGVIEIDRLAAVAARGDVADGAWGLRAEGAGHDAGSRRRGKEEARPDPDPSSASTRQDLTSGTLSPAVHSDGSPAVLTNSNECGQDGQDQIHGDAGLLLEEHLAEERVGLVK